LLIPGLNIRATLEQSLDRSDLTVVRSLKQLAVQAGVLIGALRIGQDCASDDDRQSPNSGGGGLPPLHPFLCAVKAERSKHAEIMHSRESAV
jgi:hypothetical protein